MGSSGVSEFGWRLQFRGSIPGGGGALISYYRALLLSIKVYCLIDKYERGAVKRRQVSYISEKSWPKFFLKKSCYQKKKFCTYERQTQGKAWKILMFNQEKMAPETWQPRQPNYLQLQK